MSITVMDGQLVSNGDEWLRMVSEDKNWNDGCLDGWKQSNWNTVQRPKHTKILFVCNHTI